MSLELTLQLLITISVAALIYIFVFHKPDFSPHPSKATTNDDILFPGNPAKIRSMNQLKSFTSDELREYNGHNDKPIYVSIGGKVFDCTPGSKFYGIGGPYEMFAGRDISLAAAKFSKEDEYLENPDLSNITPSELDSFFSYYNTLYGKYNMVGILTDVDYSKQLEQLKQNQIQQLQQLSSTPINNMK